MDTYGIEERAEVLYLKDIYEAIGYRCLEVSSTENINVEEVKNLMRGKVSMFSGHSGVGKTTLINAATPHQTCQPFSYRTGHFHIALLQCIVGPNRHVFWAQNIYGC